MTPKSFAVFAVITAAMVAAAAVAVALRPAPTSIPTDRALVFPALGPALNKVAAVEIATARRKFTVKRAGKGWVVAELRNVPALFDKVKTVLVELAGLRFLEPKTSDPARYARLEVEDIAAEGAKSTRVVVRDAAGKVLAKGIIGKRNDSLFGSGKGGTYLRLADDPNAWLAEGIVELGSGPADWVARKIIDLKRDEVREVVIRSPKGGTVVVRRNSRKDKDFTLEAIPKGKKQRGQWETNQMPAALEDLNLVDLRRDDEIDFKTGAYVGEFVTFDGLVVRTEAAKIGKKYWARFAARVADEAKAAARTKVKARAAAINARLKGKVYEVSETVGKKLTCEHVNLLEGAGLKACA